MCNVKMETTKIALVRDWFTYDSVVEWNAGPSLWKYFHHASLNKKITKLYIG